MTPEIKILVPLNGISQGKRAVTFEANGFSGSACKDATKAFESAMGTVLLTEDKPELYDTEERREFLNDGGL